MYSCAIKTIEVDMQHKNYMLINKLFLVLHMLIRACTIWNLWYASNQYLIFKYDNKHMEAALNPQDASAVFFLFIEKNKQERCS